MNKHLPVLIVLLGFGLVGCATQPTYDWSHINQDYIRQQSNEFNEDARNIDNFYSVNSDCSNYIIKEDYEGWGACRRLESDIDPNVNTARLVRECKDKHPNDNDSFIDCINLIASSSSLTSNKESLETLKSKQEKEKQRLIASLSKRCEDYGFTGDNNIAACIQREAQHDKELEMQKWELEKTRLALQQAQSRTYVQQQPEEEEVPLLIQMLGDIAVGVAEGYKNQQIYQQPQQKQSIYRNCKPNC